MVYTIYELSNRKRKQEDQPEEEVQKAKQPCLTTQECQTNVTVLGLSNGDPERENKNDLANNKGKEQEQDRPLDLVKNSKSANKTSEQTTKITNGHDNSKETIISDNNTPLFKDFIQSKLNKESNSQKFSKDSNNQKNSKETNSQKQKNSKELSAQKPLKEQTRNRKEKSKVNGHAPHPLNYKLHNGKLNGKEMYKISKETKRLINEMPEYGKVTKLNGIHSNTTNSVSEYEFVD